MRRLAAPLLGIGATGVLAALMSGTGTGVIGGLAGVLAFAVLVAVGSRAVDRRRAGREPGWSAPATVTFRPAVDPPMSPSRTVAMAIGRVEAREMASSASLGVGIGFCLLILLLLGRVWAGDYRGGLPGVMELYPIYLHPLAGMVVLATHRARTRAGRDGVEELFAACPTSQATRTTGHLLTAWVPATIAVVFLVGMTALVATETLGSFAEIGARQIAALLGASALCVGATALGVALARWAPWTLAPVVAVVVVGFGSIRLATAGERLTEPIRQLSTWLNDPEEYVTFTAPHWLAHHLWIVALVGIFSVVALSRDVLGRPHVAAGASFVVLAVASAVMATRPIDTAAAARIASLINDPEGHQRCVDAAGLPVCTYGASLERAEHLAKVVSPVVRAAPVGVLAGWAIRQETRLDTTRLDPAVQRLLAGERPADRSIPMDQARRRDHSDQAARFWVALTAVGVTDELAPSWWESPVGGGADSVLNLDHQARGVVALWLATRDLDPSTAAAMTSSDAGVHDSSNFTGSFARPWPDVCYAGPAPVTWALADVDAARRLLAIPEPTVSNLVHTSWPRLTDPATPTDELLAMAGLDPGTNRPGSTQGGGTC